MEKMGINLLSVCGMGKQVSNDDFRVEGKTLYIMMIDHDSFEF